MRGRSRGPALVRPRKRGPMSGRPRIRLVALGLGGLLLPGLVACGEDAPPEWTGGRDHRWRPLDVRGSGAGFTTLDPERTGITAANELAAARALESRTRADGSGVALADADGDGRTDVYLARIEEPNVLYRNLGGWRFEDVTERAGVALPGRPSTGAAFADVDGDGDADLLVAQLGEPNVLFLNDGTGAFRDASAEAGFTAARASRTMALADVDADGDLDLYVANNKTRVARDLFPPERRTPEAIVRGEGDAVSVAPELAEHWRVERVGDAVRRFEIAEEDELYLNLGDGRFEPAPFTGGRFLDRRGEPLERAPRDWGLSARFHDIDGDGAQDLYVCNDFESPDHIWMNDGRGRFREAGAERVRTTSLACMSVVFSDIDRDGDDDFFTADMEGLDERRRKRQIPPMGSEATGPGEWDTRVQRARNTLQVNRGDGTFADVAPMAGVAGSEWTWGSLFLDVDLDGFEDLVLATGHAWDLLDADAQRRAAAARDQVGWREENRLYPPLRFRNLAFRNAGDWTFEERGEEWLGPEPDIAHGIASGDLDGDGDLDLVLTRLDQPPLVLRNDAGAPRVAVRLRGRSPNTAGVGATIRLLGGPVGEQRKTVAAGGLYLSSAEPLVVFAAGRPARGGPGGADGSGPAAPRLEVRWPSGALTRVQGVEPNRLYEIREPEAAPPSAEPGGAGDSASPTYESVALDHRHVEAPFDELSRQPLLPYLLSRLGPGASWIDADADGDPDLFVAGGRGGRLRAFRNDGGRFREADLGLPRAALDQTTVLGLPGAAGGADLLVGQMNYEAASPAEARATPAVLRVRLAGLAPGAAARAEPLVPGEVQSTGPLALADIDGDGDLDLFVGGRVAPTIYPRPVPSRVWRNEGGRFVPDPATDRRLAAVGLVSAATFSDVDLDGDPDLLLALEWGPLRLFRNEGGAFRDATRSVGLDEWSGRWNGLATGDLDADGRPDLVATSWGLNTGLEASRERPLLAAHGDVDGNGTYDVILARHDEAIGGVAPLERFRRIGGAIPPLRRAVPSFAAYAEATLAEILGPRAASLERVEAITLAHTAFLNRGDRFEAVRLPRFAQVAPAFAVAVADHDGDGHEDVFLGQNFFATVAGEARHDAGRSLWLRGDGSGALEAVPARRSGIAVYGDVRGAALADYDADGRLDLAVTQNGAATRLFHNVGAAPGLRVRLSGPPGNPHAVGAAIRIAYADGSEGPLREVQAGSGYWSQSDAVQVLGLRGRPRAVRVRWPGGAESEVPLPEGAREIVARDPAGSAP